VNNLAYGFLLPGRLVHDSIACPAIVTGVCDDGLAFALEKEIAGPEFLGGGMPSALLLPDNRVRMFLNGERDGVQGIFSLISNDSLNSACRQACVFQHQRTAISITPSPSVCQTRVT